MKHWAGMKNESTSTPTQDEIVRQHWRQIAWELQLLYRIPPSEWVFGFVNHDGMHAVGNHTPANVLGLGLGPLYYSKARRPWLGLCFAGVLTLAEVLKVSLRATTNWPRAQEGREERLGPMGNNMLAHAGVQYAVRYRGAVSSSQFRQRKQALNWMRWLKGSHWVEYWLVSQSLL